MDPIITTMVMDMVIRDVKAETVSTFGETGDQTITRRWPLSTILSVCILQKSTLSTIAPQ